jgi:YD repeat-containing protein
VLWIGIGLAVGWILLWVGTYDPMTHPTAAGLLQSVAAPLVRPETFTYDARGNLAISVSPARLTTTTVADVLGRVTSVTQPGGAQKLFTYDAVDQVVEEHSYGPARRARSSFTGDSTYTAEDLWVHTYRNMNGQPDSVARWQLPDPAAIGRIVTHWLYDGAGRPVVEIAPDSTPATLADNPRDSTVYDPAGNATDAFTRRGFHLVMVYDTLNRLSRRITPAATRTVNPTSVSWAHPDSVYFPYFGQDATWPSAAPSPFRL